MLLGGYSCTNCCR